MRGLWKVPDLWTRKRPRAHKVLGRRQTAAGAHTYHRPRRRRIYNGNGNDLRPCVRRTWSAILTTAHSRWPVFNRSRLAGFQRSVTRYRRRMGRVFASESGAVEIGRAHV